VEAAAAAALLFAERLWGVGIGPPPHVTNAGGAIAAPL
uniref:Uncharacterized protein n=1 Tax=Romanomermis culicivorax TaxID=13658 RepID=A0A915JK57_ROMCU